MSIAGVAVAIAVAIFGCVIAFDPGKKMQSYCAMLPDTIGLYTGNHVTMRGIPVGTVTRIAQQGQFIRVDFDVDATYPLRGDVAATTVSDTLVADRNLAVLSGTESSPQWDPGHCVTNTLTPKSMTETLRAISKLAGELGGGDDPAEQDRIRTSVGALDAATSGTGPRINALINKLGAALQSPDAAIGHVGALITSLSSLSASVSTNWAPIKDMLPRLDDLFSQVNSDVWVPVVEIVDSLTAILPWLNDITREFGGPILNGLDATVPYIRFVAAKVGTLTEIIHMIPPIVGAFAQSVDPSSGKLSVTYAQNSGDDLVPFVLGMVGAR